MEVHATENAQAWVPKTKPKWSLALEYHSPAPSPIHPPSVSLPIIPLIRPLLSSLSKGLFPRPQPGSLWMGRQPSGLEAALSGLPCAAGQSLSRCFLSSTDLFQAHLNKGHPHLTQFLRPGPCQVKPQADTELPNPPLFLVHPFPSHFKSQQVRYQVAHCETQTHRQQLVRAVFTKTVFAGFCTQTAPVCNYLWNPTESALKGKSLSSGGQRKQELR